jgi:hypothetical protein
MIRLTAEVNKGNNITFRNSVCIGGHGASVSATNGVSNVLINNITSKNSLYATRFKSSLNSVGNITNASATMLHWPIRKLLTVATGHLEQHSRSQCHLPNLRHGGVF